jgi:hypothetical protein
MPATPEIDKQQTDAPSPAGQQRVASGNRAAAIVQAAYILEARTR